MYNKQEIVILILLTSDTRLLKKVNLVLIVVIFHIFL